MTLKPRAIEYLRKLSVAPRTLHGFTHAEGGVADIQCAPHVVKSYLDELVLHDLISPPAKRHGYYTVTQAGLEYLANLPQVAPSTLICNASMPAGSYKPREWPIRAGGEAHKAHKSVGLGV
jgi:hypothetical protein